MAIRDLITPDFIRNVYAAGVDLRLDDGSPFPDELFEQAIDSAVATIEAELSIVIDPFFVKGERHDAIVEHKDAFYPFMLDHRPVRAVNNLEITLGNYAPVVMPKEWAVVSSAQAGQIHLIPTSTTIGSFFFRSGIPLLFGDVFSPYRFVPSYFAVDYQAGFYFEEGQATIPVGESSVEVEFSAPTSGDRVYFALNVDVDGGGSNVKVRQSGTNSFTISAKVPPTTADMEVSWIAHTVDPLLVKAIGLIAAITPLDVAGDLIAGAGIANFSVGVDGLSQSIGTTASATSAGYGARIISFQKQLAEAMQTLRGKYRMINTFSV